MTKVRISRPDRAPVSAPGGSLAGRVVTALVDAGVVSPGDRGRAESVVGETLATGRTTAPRGPRLAVVAGFVGGALVLAAVGLLLAQEWPNLSTDARILWLAGIAVVLGLSTVAMAVLAGPYAELRTHAGAVRHHLTALLTVLTAVAAAGAVGVWVDSLRTWSYQDNVPMRWALVAALVVLVAGYALNAHPFPHLAGALAAFMLITASFEDNSNMLALVGALVGLGWLVLAELEIWREPPLGRLVGSAYLLFAVQALGFDERGALVYLLTLGLAVVLLALYMVRDDVAYLVMGVITLTIGVTQTLVEWTDGSLGAGGAVLVAGLTLLVASGVSLRLHGRRAREG